MINFLFLSIITFLSTSALGQPVSLKFPVVLIHGASKTGSVISAGPIKFGDYFRGVSQFYEALNIANKTINFPGDGNIESRGLQLDLFIKKEFPNQKVNLICHSMGGLDARYAASSLKNKQIASITTIATPHHGSPLASWVIKQRNQRTLLYQIFELFGFNMNKRRFAEQITTDYVENTFNKNVIDRKDIVYLSVRSRASIEKKNLNFFFWLPNYWISLENSALNSEGNDGAIPFLSQGWGTVIADYEFDHLAQINHYWLRRDHSSESMIIYQKIYEELLKRGL